MSFLKDCEEDQKLLIEYLRLVDKDFYIPLSNKVDLVSFSTKLLKYGFVICVNHGHIEGLLGGYANDLVNHTAYLSILSTLKDARGKGYAKQMLTDAIKYCKMCGMKKIICDTVNPVALHVYKSVGFIMYKSEKIGNFQREHLELNL